MNLKARAQQIKEDFPVLLLALRKPETPPLAKLFAGITIAHLLSPIDLIPDFVPVLGYLDDLLLVPALIALTLRCIPTNVMAQCREEVMAQPMGMKRKKWYYAIPVLLIWALFALWIYNICFS